MPAIVTHLLAAIRIGAPVASVHSGAGYVAATAVSAGMEQSLHFHRMTR